MCMVQSMSLNVFIGALLPYKTVGPSNFQAETSMIGMELKRMSRGQETALAEVECMPEVIFNRF